MSRMSYNAVWELNTRLVRWPRLIYKEFETTPSTSEKYGRIADQPCGRAWSRCTSSESCTAQRRSDVERTSRLKWWRCDGMRARHVHELSLRFGDVPGSAANRTGELYDFLPRETAGKLAESHPRYHGATVHNEIFMCKWTERI